MTPVNNLKSMPTFAAESDGFLDDEYLESQAYKQGFEPFQNLPATWYNTLLQKLTEQAQATKDVVSSIYAELKNAVEAGGYTLDVTKTNQLELAIKEIAELPIATGTVLGGVKSSAAKSNVLVNADGTMTPNALSDWTEEDGTVKDYIEQNAGGDAKYQFMPDYAAAHDWLTGTIQPNTPYEITAPGNGYYFISLRVRSYQGGAGAIISVDGQKMFDFYEHDEDSTNLICFACNLPVSVSSKVSISISTNEPITLGTYGGYIRFVPLKWVSDAPEIHATSATYLRPEGSTSKLVHADANGLLDVHALRLT